MVTFDKEKHLYKNAETGEIYSSVSQLISKYKPFFDKDFWAEKVAKKEKISKSEVLERWKKSNETACNKGKDIHTIIENYVKDGKIDDPILIQEFQKCFDKDQFINVSSEKMLWSHDHKIAGTSDCIADVNELLFDVYDFKTNKKFLFYNKYGEYLKAPLNNLQHCQYNEYSLQLSIYAFLYGRQTGKKVRKIEILYHDGQFHNIPVPYLYWEVEVLLKHYGQTIAK